MGRHGSMGTVVPSSLHSANSCTFLPRNLLVFKTSSTHDDIDTLVTAILQNWRCRCFPSKWWCELWNISFSYFQKSTKRAAATPGRLCMESGRATASQTEESWGSSASLASSWSGRRPSPARTTTSGRQTSPSAYVSSPNPPVAGSERCREGERSQLRCW